MPHFPGARLLLASWGVVEVVFFLHRRNRLQQCNQPLPYDPDVEHIARTKERFLKLKKVIDIREFLSGWFKGAPFEDIWRGNVEDFVAYAFYGTTFDGLSDKPRELTVNFIESCESTWGIRFPPGTKPDVAFMAHLWEPLRVVHKPLAVHLVSEAAAKAAGWYLTSLGFACHSHNDLPYWIRRPAKTTTASSKPPLVFLHGVGFGLAIYIQLIRALVRSFPDQVLIIAEFAHVSMRVASRSTAVDDLATSIRQALHAHGFQDACIFSHSFGCFVASRLCQMYPEVVHALVMVDPVCMLTCCPQLLHSFIYKPLGLEALSMQSVAMDVARWLCARDLGIAEAFCRGFVWHSLMLWPEDLPARCLLCMGVQDDLVPAGLVRAQLEAAGSSAQVLERSDAHHGAFLANMKWQADILRATVQLFEEPDVKAADSAAPTMVLDANCRHER